MTRITETTRPRVCPLCEATCGLAITTRGRDVVSIRGDEDDVFSRGYLCPKATALAHLDADPDRLRHPMLRRGDRWSEVNRNFMVSHTRASDVSGGLGSLAKFVRLGLQSGMLGLGAYLVINQEATAGIIIAASILTGRALAPVDLAIAHWRGFSSARQSWQRIDKLLMLLSASDHPMQLAVPKSSLSVEMASVAPPGTTRVVVSDVTFHLKSGQGLGVVGPSASGKSSLARMLVGVWAPARGKIRIG